MPGIFDFLQPQANQAATSATNAALDTAAARPFNVVLSVDDPTKAWLTALAVIVALVAVRRRA